MTELNLTEHIVGIMNSERWEMSFTHKGYPVTMSGETFTQWANVEFGGKDHDLCIVFPFHYEGSIHEVIDNVKMFIDEYIKDYEGEVGFDDRNMFM